MDSDIHGDILNLLQTNVGKEAIAGAGKEEADDEEEGAKVEPLPEGTKEGAGQNTVAHAKVYTYAGTLQHVTNRFCTEREHKHGSGQIFCNELQAMQHSWIDAEALGNTQKYSKFVGFLMGHYCPDMDATRDARCLVLSLLTKGIPNDLKWNPDKKRYLQLTADLGKHYCKVHGDKKLFCPLVKALRDHYFKAVTLNDNTRYLAYVKSLQKHYCTGDVEHAPDERCSIFPLLLQALPEAASAELVAHAAVEHGKVLENRHVTANDATDSFEGEHPGQDHSMIHRSDIRQMEAMRKERMADMAKTDKNYEYKVAEFDPSTPHKD